MAKQQQQHCYDWLSILLIAIVISKAVPAIATTLDVNATTDQNTVD